MNKNTPQVSIIIPIYNIEKYVEKCVHSVLQQTYKNIEIILVNDGATDGSGLLCDKLALQDARINVLHKKNGGLSDARNVGTDHANGAYIYYLDGDDCIAPNCIELLHNAIQEYNADIVQGAFYYSYPTYNMFDTRFVETKLLDRTQAMQALLEQDIVKNFAWGKLYKKELVQAIPFKKGAYFEDSFWQYKVIDKINNYVIIPERLYYYNQREDSISAKFSSKNIDLLKGTFERLLFIQKKYPNLYSIAVTQFEKLFFQGVQLAINNRGKRNKEILKLINEVPLSGKYQFKNKWYYYACTNAPFSLPIINILQRIVHKLVVNKNQFKKIPIVK